MAKYGTILNLDKELDKQVNESHRFLEDRERLLEHKRASPSSRITAACNPLAPAREEIKVAEVSRTGLKGPKVHFMRLDKYEKIHGKVAAEKVKSMVVREGGREVTVQGVDVIFDEVSCLHRLRQMVPSPFFLYHPKLCFLPRVIACHGPRSPCVSVSF